jgi:hypothetical protein
MKTTTAKSIDDGAEAEEILRNRMNGPSPAGQFSKAQRQRMADLWDLLDGNRSAPVRAQAAAELHMVLTGTGLAS